VADLERPGDLTPPSEDRLRLRLAPRHAWRLILAVVAVALSFVDSPRQEHLAYIDPGFGAMMLQLLTAGFFGLVFYLRRTLARLVARLRGRVID
jgi:hypothetical protein